MIGGFLSARQQEHAQRTMREQHERTARMEMELHARRRALIGRTFKCGPHRWRIVRRMELDLRPGAVNYLYKMEQIGAERI